MPKAETDNTPKSVKPANILLADKDDQADGLASKAATVAIIGLGIALIEVELIPGMLLGVAAVLAPNLFPKIGRAIRPLVKGAVRAAYAMAEKTRETVAEAGEHFQDIVAEVKSESNSDEGSGAHHQHSSKAKT